MSDEFIPAEVTVQADNDQVRVTRYHFPPMGETGWHKHGHDYVVVPTIGGTLTMIDENGSRTPYDMAASDSYYRTLGVAHNVVNLSDAPVEFVEIELK